MKRRFTKLMAALALLALLVPIGVWGQTTYKLQQVTSVEAGGLYVFEQGGYVMNNNVSSNALQTTSTYNSTGLTGAETYVWTLETATNGFYFKNVSLTSSQYLNNTSSTNVSFGNNNSIWSFNFQDDETVLIQNKSNSNRFLGYTTATSHAYKAYAAGNLDSYPHAIKVYKLVEETTDPTITLSKTSLTGFNYVQGSGPSESQSFKVSGANLGDNITVSLDENSNYEMSAQDGDNWLTITSIELLATNGTVGETTLYVRMKSGLTASEITGTITAASEGATEKFISLSGSVTPTYTLTYSATNGSISGVSGATAVESGTALIEGTVVALTAQPSEGYRFVSWSDGGTNTLSSTTDNPTTFTMGTANVTVTATFEEIPTHTVTFSVNGTTTTSEFVEGAAIVFPSDPEDINGMSFMGWVESAIIGTTDEAPSFVTSATMGTSDVTYYAVFATSASGAVIKTDELTLATTGVSGTSYSSWSGKQATNDAHSEAVYAGCTAGGNSSIQLNASTNNSKRGIISTTSGGKLKKVTITWNTNSSNDRSVTVYGKNKPYTNVAAFNTDKGTELGKIIKGSSTELTITCDSTYVGFYATQPIYMDKISIDWEITGTVYSDYCTTVPAVVPPVITVAENPFVIFTTATITCATPGATIMYGFDNENWGEYSAALTINTTTTIYAKAVKDSYESTVSSVVVTKNLAEPTVTIDASGITNTNVYNGTNAGSLSATVTYNQTPIEGATVTWSGNNEEVATIDANTGVVTLVAAGSVTFTATYAGNSDYSAKTATYNMTVTYNNPNGAGTRCNPYTVAEAKELMADWTANTTSPTDVYVIGIVCSVSNPSSNSQKYYISDDGENTNTIYIYNGKGLGGANMTSDNALVVGEQVIVKGKLLKYQQNNNLIDEFNAGSVLVLEIYAYDDNEDGENESYDCYRVIEGYGSTAGSYYLVASPIDMEPNENGVNMITDDGTDPENYSYDLYSFDQSQNQEWRNYRQGAYNIVPGKGYLYANKENVTINFWGEPTVNSTTLSKTANAEFEGMNLVGNPLVTKAYIGRSFYIMNSEGTELIVSQRNFILPMEGVFVSAEGDGEPLSFSNEAPVVTPGKGNLNIQVAQVVSSRGTIPAIDRAMISFNGNDMLPKFQLNPNSTKVYIPQGNKDYAVVRSNAQGEMPVNFKAESNGTYTISVEPENVEMTYLHLIDNKTGADVDLLATPSYTFEAKTSDYASRFRLVFSANSVASEGACEPGFAYFNGSNWTISNMGEATLQVVDVMGRVLSSETLSGNAEVNINQPTGVYMLRLVSGDSVKVQKVVVR